MIAASDTVILSEEHSYFRPVPGSSVDVSMVEDSILFCDNTVTVTIISDLGEKGITKPRSRHYALRHFRVAEYAAPGRLYFCPTTLMRADALTKVEVTNAQRRLLLFNDCVEVEDSQKVEEYSESSGEEEYSISGYVLLGGEKLLAKMTVSAEEIEVGVSLSQSSSSWKFVI